MAATAERDCKARLEAKGLVGTCEACGVHSQWTVADDEYQLVTASGEARSRMPVHAVVCGNCGHVRLFNANVL
jgi:hypothetical protein